MSNFKREVLPGFLPWLNQREKFPWWALILLVLSLFFISLIINNPDYQSAFTFVIPGLKLTVLSSIITFSLAVALGLLAGIGRLSKFFVIRQLCALYINAVRSIPLLVLILYFAFVITPLMISMLNSVGDILLKSSLGNVGILRTLSLQISNISIRSIDMLSRGLAALVFSYGAFVAEIFRAGIEAISKGQMDAARSLGMSHYQAMKYIILPQAIRIMIPPLVNDFISIVKDTSLLSVLGVAELTQLAKLYRAATYQTFEVWNTITFIYLAVISMLQIISFYIEKMAPSDKGVEFI